MKLRKKLIMSCAALAACATTLVSSTFAWYTSNTDVSADGISGTTADVGSDLLLISDNGAVGTWSNKVTVADATAVATTMKPVQYAAGADNAVCTLTTWNSGSHEASDTQADATDYIRFDVCLKATDAVDVYLESFTLTQTKAPAESAILANAGGLEASSTVTTYTVDARRVLQMEIHQQVITDDVEGAESAALYELEDMVTAYADSIEGKSNINAHTYYNAVTGASIATDTPHSASLGLVTTGGTNFKVCTTPVGNDAAKQSYVRLTFTIFMNGWDLECFDACQDQGFTVALKFTCETTGKSLIQTKTVA